MPPQYVTAESWNHIFDDRWGEAFVRFVYDAHAKRILAMDIQTSANRPWCSATSAEIADVEEEIATTTNLDYALMEGEVEETDEVPDWAADRVPGVARPAP